MKLKKLADEKKNSSAKSEPTRAEVVSEMIAALEIKLKAQLDEKGTLGDYIKLIQLAKDLGADQPREIKVTWIDQDGTDWTKPDWTNPESEDYVG